MLTVLGVVLGITVAVITADVIIGVIAGASFTALTVQSVKLWIGADRRRQAPVASRRQVGTAASQPVRGRPGSRSPAGVRFCRCTGAGCPA